MFDNISFEKILDFVTNLSYNKIFELFDIFPSIVFNSIFDNFNNGTQEASFNLLLRFPYIIFCLAIIFLLMIIFLLRMKEKELKQKESIIFDTVYQKGTLIKNDKKDQKWKNILDLLNSQNENDWKTAIINADNLLSEALEEKGYLGESVAERLKNSDFNTLQNAWLGHKVRNEIVHDSSYQLTSKEAKTTLSHFGKVFKEFYHL